MTPQEKTCFKCGKTFPLDNFYRHPMMKDGHLNKCKICTRIDVKNNRKKNIEYYREYDVRRLKTEHRKQVLKRHQSSFRIKHYLKYRCRNIFNAAVRDKKIFKQPCEICGSLVNIQGHHEDYTKPLDVIWLCFKHHRWIHS